MNLHPASLDDVYVVLGAGVEAVSAESAPEVAPQPTGPCDHGSHDGPGEGQRERSGTGQQHHEGLVCFHLNTSSSMFPMGKITCHYK